MKGKIISLITLLALIFVCTSGLIEPITKVFVWLITLQYNSPDISIFGQLVAKYGTWLITYSVVGIIFKSLNWFDKDVMKIVYFILSTIISFVLSYVIMLFEKYMLIISIIIGVLSLIAITVFVIQFILDKKKEKEMIS